MARKIEKNIGHFETYDKFYAAMVKHRDRKKAQLVDKMRAWYALDQQVKYLDRMEAR